MLEKRDTVVRNITALDEDEFHGHFMAMLGRLDAMRRPRVVGGSR